MKVTFTEVPDSREEFEEFWKNLSQHVKDNQSQLVLLNEFCFIPWIFAKKNISLQI